MATDPATSMGQSPSGDLAPAKGRIPAGAPTLDFSGRRVLIAGGSKGIGREMALAFAGAGAQVSVCARGQAGLDALRADALAQVFQLHTFSADLADAGQIQAWLQAAADALGGIDVLVNNATGYGMADDEDGWAASLQIDLMAAVRASRLALPWLRASSDACILNLSSIAAQQPRPGGAPYAAAKAALSHYTTSQALALARDRIRVNAIAPGSIAFDDGLWDRRRTEDPALYHGTLAKIPFGRFGHPREIADAALFLCSPLARWITGHVLNVDGGQVLMG
nr:SDR family oxidoreductase [Stenotrophomonas maltophilia]